MLRLGLAAAFLLLPVSAAAQSVPETTSAADPAGMARALQFAGYPVAASVDSFGDPLIETDFDGYPASIVFYGCDELTRDNCQSVQLIAGFDTAREVSWDRAYELFGKHRFIALSKDGEGDLFIQWDIFLGEGIPTPVFMRSLRLFADEVAYVAGIVFAEAGEGGGEEEDGELAPAVFGAST